MTTAAAPKTATTTISANPAIIGFPSLLEGHSVFSCTEAEPLHFSASSAMRYN